MVEIRKTPGFDKWLKKLNDPTAKARIAVRIARLAAGNPGDVRPIGKGLSELRIDHGAGYRVYFVKRGDVLIVLLCGGDKRSQAADIAEAKALATQIEE
jgi:putative addiction module killer protein